MTDEKRRNRLADETSPYLRQHADNPVDWHPWGPEALERARREDRPILLSIGYSACHWCHVMAHESFEDENTAAVMNERFVNIKVDREERPDLDRIYQLAHQMLTQRPGGWPLTVFLTPEDQTPFFAGTYFPDQPRHGMPAFTELLERVSGFFDENREDLEKQNEAIREVFRRLESPHESDTPPSTAVADSGRKELAQAWDREFGGFGGAPKFPQPGTLEFLLRDRARHPETSEGTEAGDMAVDTLRHMVHSGLYDAVGGGFFRYCVDDRWEIPHFEKMLYDNGPLLGLCARAWHLTGEDAFRSAARSTADWCLREMQSPEGGFYATLDADSDGREGGFYLWDPETVREQLPADEWEAVSRRYGLEGEANFEGLWHLQPRATLAQITEETGVFETDIRGRLESAAGRLADHREETRERPARDEKVLTAWNGLMIRGLATAGLLLNDRAMIDAASRAVDFAYEHLWRDGRLFAVWKGGRPRFTAYLDDYAFLAEGLFELLQARWRDRDMRFLREIIGAMLAHFHAETEGGFFFTADDHEKLIHRPRPFMDESTPSGNGAALRVLTRLGYLTGESELLSAAEDTVRAAWPSLIRFPQAHGTLLCGLLDNLAPGRTVCLSGPGTEEWKPDIAHLLGSGDVLIRIPPDAEELPGMLADRRSTEDAAWVCRGTTCRAAVSTRRELRRELEPGG